MLTALAPKSLEPFPTYIIIQRQTLVLTADVHQYSGVAHRTHQELVVIARMELYLQDRRRKPILLLAVPTKHVPDAHVVVGRGGQQLVAIARPAQAAHRVYVGGNDLCDAARQKVPDDHAPIVTANG